MGARERGMLLDGELVPDTSSRVLRAPEDAWFAPGSRGTRMRRGPITLVESHWTAGAEHDDVAGLEGDRVDDAGIRVFRNMRARRNDAGEPMQVGVELVIAACGPDDEWAEIWQLADPLETACVHITKSWDERGIGIERCMPGSEMMAKRLGSRRPIIERFVAGQTRRVAAFYPGEVRSFLWLIDTLAKHIPTIPRHVPATKSGELMRTRMTRAQMRRARGLVEHFHAISTTKIDTGSLAIEQACQGGWKKVVA